MPAVTTQHADGATADQHSSKGPQPGRQHTHTDVVELFI
jgi:hypothetical protein